MKLRAPLTQILARILLLAICFGALAPSVSQWLHPVKVLTAAVCGKDGLKNISLIPAEEQKTSEAHHAMWSCGYCFLENHSPVLAMQESSWRSALQMLTLPAAWRDYSAPPHALYFRVRHPTRAPPALSLPAA